MTFLQLAQRLRQEARIAGTGPTSVLDQTGEMQRLCDWIANAWFDIQGKHQDWRFLRSSVSFATVNAQATYTPAQAGASAATFSRWVRDSFRVYNTATGQSAETPLFFMPYESWRNTYQLGAMRTSYSMPNRITVTPNNSLGLGPVPTGAYTVVGDYYSAPILLAANADVPALPATHNHMIIVWKALMAYGASEENPASYAWGKSNYDELYDKLLVDQGPTITFGGGQ